MLKSGQVKFFHILLVQILPGVLWITPGLVIRSSGCEPNSWLKLSKNIFGMCNPKSSTGRLNIFCRTILDYCDEYEKIPKNYNGEMFIEITTRSFDIKISKGDKLNQMRLRKKINTDNQ